MIQQPEEGDSPRINVGIVIGVVVVVLLLSVPAHCGGCVPPKEFPKHGFMDQKCRLGIRVKEDGLWWLLRPAKDGHVVSREAVDCSKAVYNPDGAYYYWPKSFNAEVWCPAYDNPEIARKLAMRNHGVEPDEPEKTQKGGSENGDEDQQH